jgi:dihydroxyacetone kinase-like protein
LLGSAESDQRAVPAVPHRPQKAAGRGIEIGGNYVGEYCTSLEMAGVSITLVRRSVSTSSTGALLAEPAETAIRVS